MRSEAELALLAPFREQLPESLFTQPLVLAKRKGGHRGNLLRARELLADTGWRTHDGILVDAAARPFEIEFLTLSANDKRTLLPYMEQLRRLGITSNIRLVESAQYMSRLREYNYDALLRSMPYGFPPGVIMRAYFNSATANIPSSANLSGIKSPVVDALISHVLGARGGEQLIAAGRALDRTLGWGYYLIPIVGRPEPRAVYWDEPGEVTPLTGASS